MPQYILLLHGRPETKKDFSPEEIQTIIQKYRDWAERLMKEKRLVISGKIRDDAGRILKGNGSSLKIKDGPYAETKEVIGGYFVIEAEDYKKAVDLSRDCPHLGFGETIEVREIEECGPGSALGSP